MIFKPSPIGVDLGSGSIKVIGLKGKKISLAAFIDITPAERDDEVLLTNRLHNFFKDIGIQGKEAVVHIPGSISFIRTVSLPMMPKGELKEAVKWEIKRQIPYSPEDAVYDYVATEGTDGIIVTFAAAERKNVQKYIFPFKEAKLNVIAVDINPLCIIRALPVKNAGNTIILDIGAKSMEIDIVKAGSLRLTRSVDIGGENIKNQLLNAGLSETDAENILLEGPIEKMQDIMDLLLKEVFRSIDYYKATFKEKTFAEVILTGGVAISHTVKNYFSQMFDIPVSVPNPFEIFSIKDEKLRPLGPRFSVAVGLARRAS